MSHEIPQQTTDQEFEEMEKYKRKPIVDMLRASVPGFAEWGNKVLSNPNKEEALHEVQSFESKVFPLPAELKDSWKVDMSGRQHDIYFNNPANGRQFRVIYSIVEIDDFDQRFMQPKERRKIKGVAVDIGYDVSSFTK